MKKIIMGILVALVAVSSVYAGSYKPSKGDKQAVFAAVKREAPRCAVKNGSTVLSVSSFGTKYDFKSPTSCTMVTTYKVKNKEGKKFSVKGQFTLRKKGSSWDVYRFKALGIK